MHAFPQRTLWKRCSQNWCVTRWMLSSQQSRTIICNRVRAGHRGMPTACTQGRRGCWALTWMRSTYYQRKLQKTHVCYYKNNSEWVWHISIVSETTIRWKLVGGESCLRDSLILRHSHKCVLGLRDGKICMGRNHPAGRIHLVLVTRAV